MRFETMPGKQGQMDWGFFEDRLVYEDGKWKKLYCFLMILGYSRMRYIEFVTDMSTNTIVQAEGYPDVQTFTTTYRKAEAIVGQYNRELAEWERKMQERQRPAKSNPPRSQRSVREQLRRLQAEGRRQSLQPRRRVVDRNSR